MSGLSLFMSNYLFSLEGPDRLVGVGLNITDDKEEKCENVCQSYRRSGRPGRLCTHTYIYSGAHMLCQSYQIIPEFCATFSPVPPRPVFLQSYLALVSLSPLSFYGDEERNYGETDDVI